MSEDTKQVGYYDRTYGGVARWLLAVGKHESGVLYAHHCTVAGLTFHGTRRQKPYLHEETDGLWARLSTPGRFGYLLDLPCTMVREFVEKLPYYVFRPRYQGGTIEKSGSGYTGKATAFRLVNLGKRSLHRNPKTGQGEWGGLVNTHQPMDIPAADALILLRYKDVKEGKVGTRGYNLKTIADMQSDLVELPKGISKSRDLPMAVGASPVMGIHDDEEEW